MSGTLRLVLGDQCSERLSALHDLDASTDVVLMAEVKKEAVWFGFHRKKLALVYAAMRNFADRLERRGVTVRYVRFDDPDNAGSLPGEIARALADQPFDALVMTECGKWDLEQQLAAYTRTLNIPVEVRPDDRFLCSRKRFAAWAEGRAQLRMEFFYREMRKDTGLLMAENGRPADARWNFDAENRKRPPKDLQPPDRLAVPPNPIAAEAIADVLRWFPDNWGELDGFGFPTTPEEAEAVLDEFLRDCLPTFGDYQDFMWSGHPYTWHGLISAPMNVGLLDPLDVCRRAEAEWRAGRAPLNCVEGFIRQIIGWREYVRGVYHLKMPEYKARNVLGADRELPWFYWSGETDMACVKDVVEVTRQHAYAHHIQRLMVTGQLAMLLGVHPDPINEWYMVVYADAYEWVELPNTHGMATFADGGLMGSKPYAASGAYINRMSDYCGRCRYDVRDRLGENACPFNSLYWDFLLKHERMLSGNHRMGYVMKSLARMSPEEQAAVRAKAESLRQAFGATVRPAPAAADSAKQPA